MQHCMTLKMLERHCKNIGWFDHDGLGKDTLLSMGVERH
jgi:hypothetical protein